MALSLPEVPAVGTSVGNELALLDIQTEHSKQLHDLGLHAAAVGRLSAMGGWPMDALVRTVVYEHTQGAVPNFSAGGVVLLENNGQNLDARPIGRVVVYKQVGSLIMEQPGFSHEQAVATKQMATDLRHHARMLGLILCPNLTELFHTPWNGQRRRVLGPLLPLR